MPIYVFTLCEHSAKFIPQRLMVTNIVTKWRQGKKISKAHLARQVKVCRAYVTRLEKGELQPSADVMFRIAEYFKCKVEDVFQRVPKGGKP